MHRGGLTVNHKIADRQCTFLLRVTIISYELYFLLFYNISLVFVKIQNYQEAPVALQYLCTKTDPAEKSAGSDIYTRSPGIFTF